MFDPWKEDTDWALQVACENDLGGGKFAKLIKDSSELTSVYDFIIDKFAELKLLYLQYVTTS